MFAAARGGISEPAPGSPGRRFEATVEEAPLTPVERLDCLTKVLRQHGNWMEASFRAAANRHMQCVRRGQNGDPQAVSRVAVRSPGSEKPLHRFRHIVSYEPADLLREARSSLDKRLVYGIHRRWGRFAIAFGTLGGRRTPQKRQRPPMRRALRAMASPTSASGSNPTD